MSPWQQALAINNRWDPPLLDHDHHQDQHGEWDSKYVRDQPDHDWYPEPEWDTSDDLQLQGLWVWALKTALQAGEITFTP